MQTIDGSLTTEVEKRTTRQVIRDMAKSTAARSMYVSFSFAIIISMLAQYITIHHRTQTTHTGRMPRDLASWELYSQGQSVL